MIEQMLPYSERVFGPVFDAEGISDRPLTPAGSCLDRALATATAQTDKKQQQLYRLLTNQARLQVEASSIITFASLRSSVLSKHPSSLAS